jgi:site-specific DNA-methyltransferase (adenine-specific)
MKPNSVDSIVTDPPYGLSFMGQRWDYDVPSKEIWKECLRVLKPGGHLLAFAGTRTQHRMAVNIEDAGFEIRDMIAWVYGSGFPKSLDVSKAIDKSAGAKREVIGKSKKASGIGQHSERDDNLNWGTKAETTDITAPSTPEAKKWEGYGTALKPALEPITVARKPLSEKNVASNVLKWGTGAINIDGCRVGTEDKLERIQGNNKNTNTPNAPNNGWVSEPQLQGRFPANLIHDGSQLVMDLFPETKSGGTPKVRSTRSNAVPYNMGGGTTDSNIIGSQGSAARFFYCPKANKKDRDEGLDGFEDRLAGIQNSSGRMFNPVCKNSSKRIQDCDCGACEWSPETNPKRRNHHPTVKPIALMEYLCRLTKTPTGGIVLDPFMGSGTTGIACHLTGREFIGIEMDAEYFEIAKRRIEHWQAKPVQHELI